MEQVADFPWNARPTSTGLRGRLQWNRHTVGMAASEAKLYVDQRQRLAKLLKEVSTQSAQSVNKEANETKKTAEETRDRVLKLTKGCIAETSDIIAQVESDFARMQLAKMNQEEIENLRNRLEKQLNDVSSRNLEILGFVRSQLQDVEWARDNEGHLVGPAEMTAALEDEVLALREKTDADAELTQLGMAIEIINHEFDSTIRTIRKEVRQLKEWADINESLKPLYENIRGSFEHLDGYLTLFTPLHRRLYRNEIDFSGADIANFLQDLFGERLKRHEIEIKATPAFRKRTIHGYPSTFYPVFVNLVDNAIFWLKDYSGPREILLNAREDGTMSVSDNGPGVPSRDRSAIFELGFSRKPGGRGLGLHISKDVLQKAQYELEVSGQPELGGATFNIKPKRIAD